MIINDDMEHHQPRSTLVASDKNQYQKIKELLLDALKLLLDAGKTFLRPDIWKKKLVYFHRHFSPVHTAAPDVQDPRTPLFPELSACFLSVVCRNLEWVEKKGLDRGRKRERERERERHGTVGRAKENEGEEERERMRDGEREDWEKGGGRGVSWFFGHPKLQNVFWTWPNWHGSLRCN